MKPIYKFSIAPALPENLQRLRELAYNIWWCWNHEAIDLFRRLDSDLWDEMDHNPVRVLGNIHQERLEAASKDDGFLAHLERVCQKFDDYMSKATWYQKEYGTPGEPKIAYFSAEFGLDETISIYAGGLGILAGDHLKSASDLGLPLVGVGLLYQEGYFRQYLNPDGWQQELYPINDFSNMPLQLQRRGDGTPLTIEVEYPGRVVVAQVWRMQVGRVPLFLLDTNIPANTPEDRDITDELYGGDLEMRIKQEILLGIGGIRALDALGIRPTVCHMNEGHSAFLALERIRILMEENGLSFPEAREAAAAGNIFTTHTPVPAGIDMFPPQLMDKYFSDYYPALGLSREEFLALGRENPKDQGAPFNMAILALRLASSSNAVSRLHGAVSRRMWQGIWPGVPEDEIPISYVTNGINTRYWVSNDMAGLLDRYLGPRWVENPAEFMAWDHVDTIPAEELWRTHERRRERLVAFARRRLRAQLEKRGAPPSEIAYADEALNSEALTIGFARRFATYKRATLILRDPERLAKILCDKERPVQIIYAGKAHPKDNEGKEMIRHIIHLARQERFRSKIVFIEDYDMEVAQYLVRGVDVWLNNPRRLLEASGTSGMKAVANGALNISILDGWWNEAYSPDVGWAIGRGEMYQDLGYQDEVESNALYDLLEKEVVPLFYDRGPDGLPRGWINKMKTAMRILCPMFNTNRMVHEYTKRFYLPSAQRYRRLSENGMAGAKALAKWKDEIKRHWGEIAIKDVKTSFDGEPKVGSKIEVQARIHLGSIKPGDVKVELYQGPLDPKDQIVDGKAIAMEYKEAHSDGDHLFAGTIPCRKSGLYGYTIRVLPKHEDLSNPYEPALILWG
ncbi:MAG: glycosyltransferase family 1 protein [bacterium]